MSQRRLLSFSQALELAQQGQPVSPEHGDFIDRVTGTGNVIEVKADQIWSPENRRIAELMQGPDGHIPVFPYFTKMTRHGIINYIPTNEDMAASWMRSSHAMRCTAFGRDQDSASWSFSYERMDAIEHLNRHLPFWMLYNQDMIGYHNRAIFIASSDASNKINAAIIGMLTEAINQRQVDLMHDDFSMGGEFFDEEWAIHCVPHLIEPCLMVINDDSDDLISDRIVNVSEPVNVFVDVDSLNELNLSNGENALEYVQGQLALLSEKFPLLNWVSFSRAEEMGNSVLSPIFEEDTPATQNDEEGDFDPAAWN